MLRPQVNLVDGDQLNSQKSVPVHGEVLPTGCYASAVIIYLSVSVCVCVCVFVCVCLSVTH